jgi:hypothetical protein
MNAVTEERTDVSPLRILLGGVASTVVVTMMMYFGARMMLGAPMDIAGELSGMLGLPWMAGMVMHLVLGMVVFSFAYALIVGPRLPGNAVVRGLIWGTLLWIVAMLVMSPMMGKGIFMGAMPPAVASLMGHLAMGVVLALIVPVSAGR